MTKHQIILVVAGLVLTIALYQLPRVVVENEVITDIQQKHSFEVSLEDRNIITSLFSKLNDVAFKENTIIFADSLARVYMKYQKIDSAERWANEILAYNSSLNSSLRSGLIFYQAFQSSTNAEETKRLAGRAAEQFEFILEQDENNLSVKSKLAMTKVVSSNPMSGIMMLREVLEKAPSNREAIFNLGILAIQSGQHEKAVGRFERLLELDSVDYEAMFYLGISKAETGKIDDSRELLQKLVDSEAADIALKATAANYLEGL
ncbi:MAG: cytochrome c-type biogenesis protein CcmH/NrfG [Oleiphilaceae bacterium]|jgi:cytochrome c-type biogenesis protein CcmH/NrfG